MSDPYPFIDFHLPVFKSPVEYDPLKEDIKQHTIVTPMVMVERQKKDIKPHTIVTPMEMLDRNIDVSIGLMSKKMFQLEQEREISRLKLKLKRQRKYDKKYKNIAYLDSNEEKIKAILLICYPRLSQMNSDELDVRIDKIIQSLN